MKSSKWLVVAIIVVLGVAVIAISLSRRAPAAKQAATAAGPSSVETEGPAAAGGADRPSTQAEVEKAARQDADRQMMELAPTGVVVRVDMVLANVNGMDLTLKDLMPVAPAMDPEQTLDPVVFQSLLDRAVERVLTFQTARRQQVDFTGEQRQMLEKMRARAMVEQPDLPPEEEGAYEAQANFESWEASARLMQDILFAASGGLYVFVTPAMIDEYYQAHSAEFEALPEDPAARLEARRKIDASIRLQLAPREDPEYQRQIQTMLDDMRAKASIRQYVQPR